MKKLPLHDKPTKKRHVEVEKNYVSVDNADGIQFKPYRTKLMGAVDLRKFCHEDTGAKMSLADVMDLNNNKFTEFQSDYDKALKKFN